MFHNPGILYITEFYSIRSLLFQTLSIRIVPVTLESASDNKHAPECTMSDDRNLSCLSFACELLGDYFAVEFVYAAASGVRFVQFSKDFL